MARRCGAYKIRPAYKTRKISALAAICLLVLFTLLIFLTQFGLLNAADYVRSTTNNENPAPMSVIDNNQSKDEVTTPRTDDSPVLLDDNQSYHYEPSVNTWQLILVNSTNKLPEGYAPELATVDQGYEVDYRCRDDLQQMLNDCRAAGFNPWICSAYRTEATQQSLFNNKVASLRSQGYSPSDAELNAKKLVAPPNYSEHQLGLAVDIVDANYGALDDSQASRPVQKWLMENSWRYGFILRYPADKTDLTGISFESWHYRYVGKQAASAIYENGLCLEEYFSSAGYAPVFMADDESFG